MTDESDAPALAHARGLAAGELRFQRCDSCGQAVHHPRLCCPGCGAASLTWQASAGRGTVYAGTVVHARDREPYNVVLVDLAEGFRVMSALCGAPAGQVAVGTDVVLDFVDESGQPVAVFRYAETQA